MRDDVAFSQVINELAQSWQIKGVNSPLLLGKSVYEALVKLRNYALVSSEPPPERGEQVQLVLNRLVTIAAIHQRRRKTPKMRFQWIALKSVFPAKQFAPRVLRFLAFVPGQRSEDYAEQDSSVKPTTQCRSGGVWDPLRRYRHNRAVGMKPVMPISA